MDATVDVLAEAQTLVAVGDERRAMQLLRAAIDETADPELIGAIHDFAIAAHESSHGFHKIEWNRLAIETER